MKPASGPELDERPVSANGLKRRQSDASEQESKRQRTSPGKNSPTVTKTEAEAKIKQESPVREEDTTTEAKASDSKPEPDQHPPKPSKRRSIVTDEKQRSKRLFGALLGNLNQPGDRTSKRRQEIEARRKAELQKQDDERVEDKQRRLDQMAEHRRKVQRRVDEENVGLSQASRGG